MNAESHEKTRTDALYALLLLFATSAMWYAFFFRSSAASLLGAISVGAATLVQPVAGAYTVSLSLLCMIGFIMISRENKRIRIEKAAAEEKLAEDHRREEELSLKRNASFSSCSASFPRKFRDLYIAKEYAAVPLLLDEIAQRIAYKWPEFKSGALLSFIPDVEHPKNVACTLDGKLIGTIGQAGLSDYLYDLLINDVPVLGYLSAYDSFACTAEIKIARYEESIFKKLVDSSESLVPFRLVGNTDDEAQNELESCERGDECTFSYDSEIDKYSVFRDGVRIGRLPASAAAIVKELEDDVVIYISDIGESSRGKVTASVYIFD